MPGASATGVRHLQLRAGNDVRYIR
jgi:hypothetical protein